MTKKDHKCDNDCKPKIKYTVRYVDSITLIVVLCTMQ